ncbi:hypothetical protein BOO69_08200 [Sulfitobacter alexandrii]|uniref:XRE family transcriptional regulator n=1 Tax=Sulfitobacter alexandrii TaxID=1917485 RepID=A0A1J0WGZ1_9RHOB|nr:helix-turn-helix transcriptional regulator [Sulfitobacter alexandrii]APE43398.1 hypothetical protein BOO69_08200 [Sulfitobacter alexandrii]
MNFEQKEALARTRKSDPEAIRARLKAARVVVGLGQKEFAEAVQVKQTTYNSQEIKGRPSLEVIRYLHTNHRIDANFILFGDFVQLPGDIQTALFEALSSHD